METLLPFILAALFFGFQIYSNLKKEQEKARQRNPSQRPKKEVEEHYGDPNSTRETRQESRRTVAGKPIHKPRTDQDFRRVEDLKDYKRNDTKRSPATNRTDKDYATDAEAFEEYTGTVDDINSTVRLREQRLRNRNQNHKQKTLQVIEETDGSAYAEFDVDDFDLRDAVIKEAILNRPYKDF